MTNILIKCRIFSTEEQNQSAYKLGQKSEHATYCMSAEDSRSKSQQVEHPLVAQRQLRNLYDSVNKWRNLTTSLLRS